MERLMYKDKDKQREANRKAQAKFKAKGITNRPPSGITGQGITEQGSQYDIPPSARQMESIVRGVEVNLPKRGLDIQCFEDLPPDVQATINRMSITDGKLDEAEKAKRTTAAIRYQHLFPNRYHTTGQAGTPNLGRAETAMIGEMI